MANLPIRTLSFHYRPILVLMGLSILICSSGQWGRILVIIMGFVDTFEHQCLDHGPGNSIVFSVISDSCDCAILDPDWFLYQISGHQGFPREAQGPCSIETTQLSAANQRFLVIFQENDKLHNSTTLITLDFSSFDGGNTAQRCK